VHIYLFFSRLLSLFTLNHSVSVNDVEWFALQSVISVLQDLHFLFGLSTWECSSLLT
jgi:hypothetical protein